jgi:hypothetical protein
VWEGWLSFSLEGNCYDMVAPALFLVFMLYPGRTLAMALARRNGEPPDVSLLMYCDVYDGI